MRVNHWLSYRLICSNLDQVRSICVGANLAFEKL